MTSPGDVCQCVEPCSYRWMVQLKSLKWRSVLTMVQYSAHWSSSLSLKTSCEFCSGVPWENLYADGLVIIAESLLECIRRILTWKEAMEEKGRRVNAGKTKIMICGTGLDLLQSSDEFPCTVTLEWATTPSSAMASSTGCTRNAVGSSAWQRTLITGVHGARELHAP